MHALLAPLVMGIDWLDPEHLMEQFGDFALWGAAAIVFAECGLLFGFFLPGDSLLFTVGLLVAEDHVPYPLWLCCVVLFLAALAGNALGYLIGSVAGPKVFRTEDSRLFKQAYVDRTREFFERYGNRAIVIARFVPLVRTFITVMAGVGSMGFRRFMLYSAVGAVLWAVGVTLLGYYLGSVPLVRDNVEVMLLAFVLVAVVPVTVEYLRDRAARKLTR